MKKLFVVAAMMMIMAGCGGGSDEEITKYPSTIDSRTDTQIPPDDGNSESTEQDPLIPVPDDTQSDDAVSDLDDSLSDDQSSDEGPTEEFDGDSDDDETDDAVTEYARCTVDSCTEAENVCMNTATGYRCLCEPGFELNEDGDCQKLETVTIRMMAANISSGNYQSYEDHGIRIFQGFKPDIILIQEFNYFINRKINKDQDIPGFVKKTFGPLYGYHRGEANTGDIPNGIISRYPIIESGTWKDSMVSNRHFEWARIDIPGERDLWAISVHLLTKAVSQPQEASDLVDYIKANIPSDDYIVIGGDFNTKSRSASALSTLNKYVVTQTDNYPSDQNGNECTNANRDHYYDGLYSDKDLQELEVPIEIAGHDYVYKYGLVFDSRVFTPIDSVEPIQANDSAASSMQHMPVIRDFKLW